MERRLTIKEVAEALRISEATLLRWIKAEKIKGFYRMGRRWIAIESELEEYISKQIKKEEE